MTYFKESLSKTKIKQNQTKTKNNNKNKKPPNKQKPKTNENKKNNPPPKTPQNPRINQMGVGESNQRRNNKCNLKHLTFAQLEILYMHKSKDFAGNLNIEG